MGAQKATDLLSGFFLCYRNVVVINKDTVEDWYLLRYSVSACNDMGGIEPRAYLIEIYW